MCTHVFAQHACICRAEILGSVHGDDSIDAPVRIPQTLGSQQNIRYGQYIRKLLNTHFPPNTHLPPRTYSCVGLFVAVSAGTPSTMRAARRFRIRR